MNKISKSPLSDLVARHSDFDVEQFIKDTPKDDYDLWNGFCLPMQITNTHDEYTAIRESCAIFDASPMKKYCFRGSDAGAFLDRVLTAPVSTLPVMKSAYGLICNEDGYLLDDGIVNKLGDDEYMFLNSEMDLDDFFAKYNDFDNLVITEETPSLVGLAIQGPKSCAVLNQFGFHGVENLSPFELKYFDLAGGNVLVGRLGFTGDLGYEIWFAPSVKDAVTHALSKAEAVLDISIPGYGLSALQICRIEAGMIVPGWDTAGTFEDLTYERTPLELTLGWNVKLARDADFVGKTALVKAKADGGRYVMKGCQVNTEHQLAFGQALYKTLDGQSVQIGTLPSVIWHPIIKQWVGLASLNTDHADGSRIYVLHDDKEIPVDICKLPFINLPQRSQTPAAI